MLRACRRILRPGGITAFFTIGLTPGLSKYDHRRAVLLGPRAVASTRAETELMAVAGFADVDQLDVTAEFLETTRAWLRVSAELESGLRLTVGNDLFEEQFADRTDLVRATEDGLLRRSLFVGTAPPPR